MHFAKPIQRNGSSGGDHQPFELSQYTPMGVEHFGAQYKNNPKVLEKLSKRISARVEQDSSELITFCDKRIRKRRKKKRLEDEARIQQDLQIEESEAPAAPEVVAANDLLLGKCLGQGSFSSVFVLEKHLYTKQKAVTPRRGRRSTHSRHMRDNKSMSTHSTMTDNSVSRRSSSRTGRSKTPSIRTRIRRRLGNMNDDSNRSDCSQRSRSLSVPRDQKKSSSKSLSAQDDSEINSPIRVLRSPKTVTSSSRKTRSRSLSSSIQDGVRSLWCGHNVNPHLAEDNPTTFMSKSKSHHTRSQFEEDNSRSGRSIFRGGSRSLSCHTSRKSRRSRSRGGEDDTIKSCATDDENDGPTKSGVLFNPRGMDGESNLVVKILQPKLMSQPKLFANCAAGLIREGLFLASLEHPHVLKVHAWTSPNGWMDFASMSKEGDLYDGYLLVLERLTGGSLKGWMRKWQDEHAEEQKAIAAVANMEAEEKNKRLGAPIRLSFTDSSCGSNSINSCSNHLRQKTENNSKHNKQSSHLVSPSSHDDSLISNESLPYPNKWPRAQLSDRMSLLMQLSDTVKYLHKHRILHRDLKPDNLGVTFTDPRSPNMSKKQYPTNLSLKVFDFDIARLVPEDPNDSENSSKKKSSKRRSRSVGSVNSFDAEMLQSRSNRSISPLRSTRSVTGENAKRRAKQRRGTRPKPINNNKQDNETLNIPIEIAVSDKKSKKQKETLFEMTAKMGSPRYMAPEIARGEAYNLKSEVYTVCLLVHEVLTLQKPYDELAPEDHSRLVHFDFPGYRPPIYSEWGWPEDLEEALRSGFGEIKQRPSMKDFHAVLKKALPKICPELLQPKTVKADETAATSSRTPYASPAPIVSSSDVSKHESLKDYSEKKSRSLFRKTRNRSSSLTPTASNSDFSLSNDEPLLAAVNVAQ